MLELALFGRFEVRLGGALVSLPSRPAQSLLAYLALNAGVPHRREKLAGLLWPEADEDNARSNLRHALWRIRKVIESDHGAPPYLLKYVGPDTHPADVMVIGDGDLLSDDGHQRRRSFLEQ